MLLDGKPFPLRSPYVAPPPAPRRTFFVSPSGSGGEGTEARPRTDLQSALSALIPGDRIVLLPGDYSGAFRVDASCRSGSREGWIQVVSRKATLRPAGEAPALFVARGYWRFDDLTVSGVEGRSAPLVELAGGADHVLVNGARLAAGSGSGLAIRAGARHVTVSNTRITGLAKGDVPAPATAVVVESGTSDVTLVENRITDAVGIGIRIGDEGADSVPPARVWVLGTTVADSWGPAVWVVAVDGLRIADSDLVRGRVARVASAEGVRLEGGRKVRLERSHLRDFALGVRVGVANASRPESSGPRDVAIERNYIETRTGRGGGIVIETASDVRIANNVLEGVAEAFVLFGRPPRTRRVVVANNLALGVSDLAFRIEDFSSLSFFDSNVFSPRGDTVSVEFGSENLSLEEFLSRRRMPQTRLVRGVRLIHRDLGHIEGVRTVDAGRPLAVLRFKGAAPDLGVAER